jgi:hypothetical protein
MEVFWMFLASSAKPIDPQLENLVTEIEAQNPSLSVLVARQFCYQLQQTLIELFIQEPRPFNVLEEFIIRAGIEIVPPPTEDELASVLGLDPVFVRSTTATLQALKTLSGTSPITVTPEGHLFYEKGLVPQPPYSLKIYAIADPLEEKLTFHSESLNNVKGNLPDLGNFINFDSTNLDISSLALEELQQILQDSSQVVHVPEQGKIVTSFKVVSASEKIWKTISLFVLFNPIEDKLSFQVRSGKQILKSVSNRMEMLQDKGRISLQALCELSDKTIGSQREVTFSHKNPEIETRLENIRQQTLEILRQEHPNLVGTALQLYDRQIAQVFTEILSCAQYQVLIYSPWINSAIVDEKLIQLLQNLANQGVWILIGYGIPYNEENEHNLISLEVEEQLQLVKTAEGLSAVQVCWLGDSHVKEVIADQRAYLCGSHHWYLYRGEYLPCGESVYQITIPDQVQAAYEFLANRFKKHAQKLWNNATQNHDFLLAAEALCVWGTLDMEEMALTTIQENNWLELLPVWLNIMLQGLRSKKVSVDSQSFKTALSLLSQFSLEQTCIESLREGLRKVISAIAIHNRSVALDLLKNQVWEEFLRLGIIEPSVSTPNEFLSEFSQHQEILTESPVPKPQIPKNKKTKPKK